MFEHDEPRRKQGRVTVLALLFGLLLGFSGSGPLQPDPGRARLGNAEVLRVASLRVAGRFDHDGQDDRAAAALLAAPPRIVTELVSVRPAEAAVAAVAGFAPPARHFHYQARAPPAA